MKILGKLGDHGTRTQYDSYWTLDNGKLLAEQFDRATIQDFQYMTVNYWKGYLPRINKAMARRMLLSYKEYRRKVNMNHYAREQSDHPEEYRLQDGFDSYWKDNRLIPLTFEKYHGFSTHVWTKRGSPKWYKKNITGQRFGCPRTYKERRTGNYNVERFVGVQCYRDKETGRVGVRMGIINQKRENIHSGDFYR
jgi:hypothetical protein